MNELSVREENLLNGLKNGRLKREELGRYTGLDDRKNRSVISSMRKKGIPIMSSSQQAGYWLAKNKNECKKFAKEILNRVKEEQAIANGVLSEKAEKFYVGD